MMQQTKTPHAGTKMKISCEITVTKPDDKPKDKADGDKR